MTDNLHAQNAPVHYVRVTTGPRSDLAFVALFLASLSWLLWRQSLYCIQQSRRSLSRRPRALVVEAFIQRQVVQRTSSLDNDRRHVYACDVKSSQRPEFALQATEVMLNDASSTTV